MRGSPHERQAGCGIVKDLPEQSEKTAGFGNPQCEHFDLGIGLQRCQAQHDGEGQRPTGLHAAILYNCAA